MWLWGATIAGLSLAVSALGTLVLLLSGPAPSKINFGILAGIPAVSLAGAAICGMGFTRWKFVSEKTDPNVDEFHQLLEMVDLAGFMVRDFNGTIRFWSNGCRDIYGWTATEAVGRSSHDLLKTVFPVPLADIEAALLRDGEWRGELRHRTRDGKEVIVAARKILHHDNSGRQQVMENVTDITELYRSRDALYESEGRRLLAQQVGHLAYSNRLLMEPSELAEKLAQTQKMHALGQLASGMAHDFNNILQTISGATTLIERRADNERVRRLAQRALDAAARGTSITERLLSFTRQTEMKREPVAVAGLLDSIREVLAHAVSMGIKVRTEIANELPTVLVDRSQLETALINLGTNARDAMPDGGRMTLAADVTKVGRDGDAKAGLEPGPYLRIKVTDTGTGMDAATHARAVEPFFTTKPLREGTGLGLSMAKAFAEQSGGALTIETALGAGTTISIWLRLVVDEIEAAATQEIELPKPMVSSEALVLLVDDDLIVRETIAAQLEDMGYRPLLAPGGSEALELIKAGERVDVLLCDLSMPGMDGVELIAHARELLPGLPSLLLTGYMGERAALASEGSFTLVRKPVKMQVLAAHIEASLKGSIA
jgi:PAS domain S-box-containing protein